MIKNIIRVLRKDRTQYDKKAVVKCDECGTIFESFLHSVKRQHTRIGKHLCRACALGTKYRKAAPNGANHFNYKHGMSQHGYRRIYHNGKNCYEHRVAAEVKLGRQLRKGEIVHHIDNDKLNNSSENIHVFESRREHEACHEQMERLALRFLNTRMWFDPIGERYVTTKPSVEFDPVKKYGARASPVDMGFFEPRRKIKASNGWVFIRRNNHKRAQHIFIIEALIGRRLYRDEDIHHINGDKTDNAAENLFLTSSSVHRKIHESLNKCLGALYKLGLVEFRKGCYFIN